METNEQTCRFLVTVATISCCLIALALIFSKCNGTGVDPTTQIITKYDTIIQTDTVRLHSVQYTPVPYTAFKADTVFIADTVYVLSDYYTTRYYADTLQDDTLAFVAVYDSVRRNEIINRCWDARYYPQKQIITVTNTITEPAKVRNFGVGVGAYLCTIPNKTIATGVVSVRWKKNNFIIGYGTNNSAGVGYIREF